MMSAVNWRSSSLLCCATYKCVSENTTQVLLKSSHPFRRTDHTFHTSCSVSISHLFVAVTTRFIWNQTTVNMNQVMFPQPLHCVIVFLGMQDNISASSVLANKGFKMKYLK